MDHHPSSVSFAADTKADKESFISSPTIHGSGSRVKMYNVIVCAWAFFFIFLAFNAAASLQPTVLTNVLHEPHLGAIALGILYVFFAVGCFLALPIVRWLGSKYTLFAAGFCCVLFLAAFIEPTTGTVLIASAISGYGGAHLWVTQGLFITENSTPKTQGRNGGIFWVIFTLSYIAGNLFTYLTIPGGNSISSSQAQTFFVILTICCVIGWLMLLAVRRLVANSPSKSSLMSQREMDTKAFVVGALKLLPTKEMAIFYPFLYYAGTVLMMWQTKLATIIGGTLSPGPALPPSFEIRMIGIHGILVGIAEMFSSFLAGRIGDRYGRRMMVLCLLAGGLLSHICLFVNFVSGWMTPNLGFAFVVSFLLGFLDCFNNMIELIILGNYSATDPIKGMQVYSIFKALHAMSTAISGFYASYVPLGYQLLISLIALVAGCFLVYRSEDLVKRYAAPSHSYSQINLDNADHAMMGLMVSDHDNEDEDEIQEDIRL